MESDIFQLLLWFYQKNIVINLIGEGHLKKTKKIAVLLIISIVFQWTVFSILDWKTDQLLNPYFRMNHAYSVDTKPISTRDFSLSYNNKYLAFIDEEELRIIDLTKNKIVQFQAHKSRHTGFIMGYKWLPDRNSLVYLIKDINLQSIFLVSVDFDITSSSESEIIDRTKIERAIDFPVDNIEQIHFSTYTNNLFLLYTNQNRNQLHKIDIMKNMNRVDNPDEEVLDICVSNKFGTVYLESKQGETKAIQSFQDKERALIAEGENVKLLGCHNNTVFWGQVNDGILESVYRFEDQQGMSETSSKETRLWQGAISMENAEIFITADTKVWIKRDSEIDILLPDGKQKSKELPDLPVVLSHSGKMYMEINLEKDKLIYYWRSI